MADTDSLSDLDIIARTLDGEAGNQGYIGLAAVGSVILTRVKLAWQGETTARGVCLHPKQLDCWLPGPDRDRIMAPDYVVYDLENSVAQMVLDGSLPDSVNGADSYIVTGTPCYWAENLTPVAVVGKQSFYITRN